MDLIDIFGEIAVRMRSDFERTRKAIEHRGLKGTANEQILRDFLGDYLLASLDVSIGEIIDSRGNRSRQADVIISDAARTPVLYGIKDIRVLPVECVIAVIEVKAKLDQRELAAAFENMRQVKALKKTAYYPQPGRIKYQHTLYGKNWDVWPTNYYVFAYESIRLETLVDVLDQRHVADKLPCDSRIDSMCVLDKGVICNELADGKLSVVPGEGSRLVGVYTEHALLLFYMLASHLLNQAKIRPAFNFNAYITASLQARRVYGMRLGGSSPVPRVNPAPSPTP